jgi:hypothetical protein
LVLSYNVLSIATFGARCGDDQLAAVLIEVLEQGRAPPMMV